MTFPSRRGSKKILKVTKAAPSGFVVSLSCGHDEVRRANPQSAGQTSMTCKLCRGNPQAYSDDEVRNQ